MYGICLSHVGSSKTYLYLMQCEDLKKEGLDLIDENTSLFHMLKS